MRRFVKHTVALAFLAAAVAGCSRHRVIPDEELALIFRDIYVANAYADTWVAGNDSISPYAPILERYGYTPRDVQYTIGNFSKRKSARISDVVDAAIELLDDEYEYYSQRVSVRKHIEEMAREMFSRKIITDSAITVSRIADTSRLRLAIPVEPGEYRVALRYCIDSTDLNDRIRLNMAMRNSRGELHGLNTVSMLRRRTERYERALHADTSDRELVMHLGNYATDRKDTKIKKPSIRVDSLQVTYYPPTAQALDSLDSRLLRYRLSIYGNPVTRMLATHVSPMLPAGASTNTAVTGETPAPAEYDMPQEEGIIE